MIRAILAISALVVLGACAISRQNAALATPYEELEGMGAEQRPVFAYAQLVQRQADDPVLTPACAAVRGAYEVSSPTHPRTDGLYGAHRGAFVFTVQCGALTTAAPPLEEKWLVAFPPGVTSPIIERCIGANGVDRCPA